MAGNSNSGKNPKPTELKLLQGTDRKDRGSGAKRPKPAKVSKVPSPPSWLGRFGKALWRKQLKQLILLDMLTEVDLNALAQYCYQYDLWTEARQTIKKEGVTNKHDQVSPHVTLLYKAQAEMLKIADRFGFTASARERLSIPEPKPSDPLSAHLSKR